MAKTDRLRLLASALENQSVMRLRDAATLLGGYIVSAADVPNAAGYTIEEEKDHFAQAKAEASGAAARLLVDSETVFIDCGTTLTTLVRQIPADMHLTVVCYSLNVAEILRRRPNVRMILLGGVYVPSSDSFASDESVETLRRMGINKAFLSAGGVDEARGVTCWNFHEVAIKQAAMASAVERHLVVDSSKFGKVKAVRFSQLDDFDSVITENGQAARRAK
jgi:DeoR family deoxyribose operon repressor